MPTARLIPLALLALVAACGEGKAPAASQEATATLRDTLPPDSHLFDTSDSTEVWLVTGRVGHGADGTLCLERGLQLRKGPLRIPVPLFYTNSFPRERDGKLLAKNSTNCVTGETYLIDLKTGQPTKLARPAR